MLYVFGYDINWWKGDEKLLILIMCLQIEKKKKIQSYIVKREEMKSWKKMQIKEVHNEVSSSQD